LAKAIIFPIYSKFIGSEISDNSLERLRKKRNFALLVVDADPQANASSGLGVDIKQSECTIYECIIDRANVQDAILLLAAK